MSLLLDALKKAAEDKQKADASGVSETEDQALSDVDEAVLQAEQPVDATQSQITSVDLDIDDSSEPPELELDDDVLELESESPIQDVPDTGAEKIEPAPVAQRQDTTQVTATPSTVTDEALQLLIRKTNSEYKKSRFVLWGGVATVALVLLALGGLYFYTEMNNEIEMMQRKHQIALASLQAKTKIEENLTSLAAVPASTSKSEQQDSAGTNTTKPAQVKAPKSQAASGVVTNKPETFTVTRQEKRDPISVKLNQAWMAYQQQDYELAAKTYRAALEQEPNNHDAMLGVAAVALQQQDIETARDTYIRLLQRDPKDPHAHAGLANIAQMYGANLSESKLKQLIEHRPDDSHLQFALGNLYVQKQSWPEAQQAFFNALQNDSQNPDYAYNLAVSLDHLGKYHEARGYYQDSLRLAAGKNINFSVDSVQKRIALLGARE
jgi:tetratricopeptide (TPR) repeat protein